MHLHTRLAFESVALLALAPLKVILSFTFQVCFPVGRAVFFAKPVMGFTELALFDLLLFRFPA